MTGGQTALGGELQASNESANTSLLNIRVVILTGSGGAATDAMVDAQEILSERLIQLGASIHPVNLGDWSLKRVPAIIRAIRAQAPDVILMQYPTAAFGASFGPIGINLLQRVAPVVVMLHEFVAAHPLRKLAIGGLTARATIVALTAKREANLLIRYYPWLSDRLRIIPIASNIPSAPWTPTLPRKVVYFGQLRPEKGIETFLECYPAVKAACPEVEFHIAGTIVPKFASFAEWLLPRARDLGIPIIQGLGSDEVAAWLAKATVALLPYPDGASFRRSSMIAAAGCGVPLVTTTGSDTPFELKALLEPAASTTELSDLAILLLSDDAALTRAHNNTLRLSRMFSWDTTVDRYVAVMKEAMSRTTKR